MPLFHYLATDKAGRPVEGTINADSDSLAATTLSQRGYIVNRVTASAGLAPRVAAPPMQTSRAVAPPAVVSASPAKVQPQTIRAPAARAPQATVKTAKASDAETYFIATQLAAFLNSGIGPQQALRDMANRTKRDDVRESLIFASDRAGEGGRLSDAFERYPYLYPPNFVGLVRAGETGGFLPEAISTYAEQADSSRRLGAMVRWMRWISVSTVVCMPPIAIIGNSLVGIWKIQDVSGGQTPPLTALWQATSHETLRVVGPISLALFVVWLTFWTWWMSMGSRLRRHKAILRVGGFKQRAKEESLGVFAWALSMLSKSGVAPRSAWLLAAQTMPNLELRRLLEEQGATMHESAKLSDAMYRSKMLPEEYAPVVETGEIAGDVPGALMRASQSSHVGFQTSDKIAKGRIGCWIVLILFLGTAFGAGVLLNYYRNIVPAVTGDQ